MCLMRLHLDGRRRRRGLSRAPLDRRVRSVVGARVHDEWRRAHAERCEQRNASRVLVEPPQTLQGERCRRRKHYTVHGTAPPMEITT